MTAMLMSSFLSLRQRRPAIRAALLACFSAGIVQLALPPDSAQARGVGSAAPGVANETPKALEDLGIAEHLGDNVDTKLMFRDEAGALVPLSKYINGSKPVILDLVYYACPNLCNFHLNGMNDAFKGMPWTIGKEFDVVVVSIDPREKPDLAEKKKTSYLRAYGRPEAAPGWHFLTGEDAQIQALAKQVGFKFRWDDKEQQFAHASAAYVLTPQGRISRYLYGITFAPKTLRLSLVEAGEGKIGTIVDKLTLWCFHYDPSTSKYALVASNIMRGGGVVAVLIMAAFLVPFWLRQRSPKRNQTITVQGEV